MEGGSDKFLMKRTPKRYISRLPVVAIFSTGVNRGDRCEGHTYSEAKVAEQSDGMATEAPVQRA